jgi:hypothetical protein
VASTQVPRPLDYRGRDRGTVPVDVLSAAVPVGEAADICRKDSAGGAAEIRRARRGRIGYSEIGYGEEDGVKT